MDYSDFTFVEKDLLRSVLGLLSFMFKLLRWFIRAIRIRRIVSWLFFYLQYINPLNAELNPICYLLALLGAHHILHISRIRVNENQVGVYSTAYK